MVLYRPIHSYIKRLINRPPIKIEKIDFKLRLIFENLNKIGNRMKEILFSSFDNPKI